MRVETLEVKRFLNADPDEMREGWEARKEREWNARYCNNESWREAIDNGWSINTLCTRECGGGPSSSSHPSGGVIASLNSSAPPHAVQTMPGIISGTR